MNREIAAFCHENKIQISIWFSKSYKDRLIESDEVYKMLTDIGVDILCVDNPIAA